MKAWMTLVGALASACGSVSSPPPVNGSVDAQIDGPAPTSYKGTLAQTSPPVPFGGPPPKCGYSATLSLLTVKLSLLPSGDVVSGSVQDVYVEGTDANCQGPPAAQTLMSYTFTTASASPTGMTLKFQQDVGNTPAASLTAELFNVNAMYQTHLTFHRTDQARPLDWTVVATVPLAQQ